MYKIFINYTFYISFYKVDEQTKKKMQFMYLDNKYKIRKKGFNHKLNILISLV